jgi:centrin-3
VGQVAMRALGFDVKKAEVQAILREYDRDGEGLISERDFTDAGETKKKKNLITDAVLITFKLK